MSDWFFMLGEALSPSEQRQVRTYLGGLGIDDSLPIESVPDWASAGRVIKDPAWDRSWWDAEESERARLCQALARKDGQSEWVAALSHALQSPEVAHGAAAVEAASRGCADAELIRVAAGSLSQALYLAELARSSGEAETHPFLIKAALFAGGHWPLGIVNGRYCVF